jgi:hypothetical protein
MSWTSRLQVQVNNKLLTPITSFTTTFTSSVTQIHSIEADNVGVVIKPKTMTFKMVVPAMFGAPDPTGPNAAALYKLAIDGTSFDVALAVQSGNDWVFSQLLFRGCYITSANPSDVQVGTTPGQLDTVPVATFIGIVTDFAGDKDIVTP